MIDVLRTPWVYRNLLLQLVKRDISARYRGSVLGASWGLLIPLLSLIVYGFVFGVILKPRWPEVEGPLQFALILFSGLLVFSLFSDCLTRAPSLLVANANFVKKVVFPLDLLAWVPVASALFNFFLGVLAWLFLNLILGESFTWTLLLSALPIAPLALMLVGLSWFVSAIGVYIRDVAQVIGVCMQLMLYLAPIIYPRDVLPAEYRWIMLLNPLTVPVEGVRSTMNFGEVPDWTAIAVYWLVSILVFCLGKVFFDKCRSGFADVV